MRTSVLGLACLVACGGADQSTSRGVAEHYVKAMDSHDAEAASTVIVPDDKLREAFDCGPNDTLGRSLQRAREDLRPTFEAFAETGFAIRVGAFAAETQQLAVGDSWRDCTAREPVELVRAQVTLLLRRGARDAEEKERWDFIRFDGEGPWWLVP